YTGCIKSLRHSPFSLSHTHTHTHTLCLSLSHTHTHTLSLSHTHTHTHTHSLSLSHTHTHTLSLSHTQTHTHTRCLSLKKNKRYLCIKGILCLVLAGIYTCMCAQYIQVYLNKYAYMVHTDVHAIQYNPYTFPYLEQMDETMWYGEL